MGLPITIWEDLVRNDEAEKKRSDHMVVGAVAGELASIFDGLGDKRGIRDGDPRYDFSW